MRRQGGRSNPLTSNDVYPQSECMAINSNVVSHFFHFRPDNDEHSVETSAKLFSELKLVTDNLSLFMQQPTEKPLKVMMWMKRAKNCVPNYCTHHQLHGHLYLQHIVLHAACLLAAGIF